MARFSFMICFAVLLAVLNQSNQVEALPARRFGIRARSSSRHVKPSRSSTDPTMDDLSRRLLQLENQLNFEKRGSREPVYLLKSPTKQQKRATGTACKKRARKAKRQLEDAPLIYNDNLPPSPSTGLWADVASSSTTVWADSTPTSTSYPDPKVLLQGVNNFARAASVLAQGPVVYKRQLVEGQEAEFDESSSTSASPTVSQDDATTVPTPAADAITRTYVEVLVPTTMTLPVLDQNGYPMGPGRTEVVYRPEESGRMLLKAPGESSSSSEAASASASSFAHKQLDEKHPSKSEVSSSTPASKSSPSSRAKESSSSSALESSSASESLSESSAEPTSSASETSSSSSSVQESESSASGSSSAETSSPTSTSEAETATISATESSDSSSASVSESKTVKAKELFAAITAKPAVLLDRWS